MLVGLGAAVVWQTFRGATLLSSVSAYYYTAAQPIFVAALLGLAACVIALRGTNAVEDVALNIAGMFAAVVAIVPTGRGEDYAKVLAACKKVSPVATTQGPIKLDCPKVRALEAATGASIENSMVALGIVGFLGLCAAVVYTDIERRRRGGLSPLEKRKFGWGLALALSVYVLGGLAFVQFRTWFIDRAHFVAAAGLLVCIVAAVAANAFRRRPEGSDVTQVAEGASMAKQGLRMAKLSLFRWDRYAVIALALLIVAIAGTVLVIATGFSLFWLEIAVTVLFIVFWCVQTVDLWSSELPATSPQGPPM